MQTSYEPIQVSKNIRNRRPINSIFEPKGTWNTGKIKIDFSRHSFSRDMKKKGGVDL